VAHALPQLRVQVAQRLVEQQQARPPDDGPRQRHALLLAAAQLRRRPAREPARPTSSSASITRGRISPRGSS